MSSLSESSRSVESGSSGMEAAAIPPSISSLIGSLRSENFANLTVAAERLVEEVDSAQFDENLVRTMKCLAGKIRKILEEFSEALDERVKGRGLMHKGEARKLWKRVEFKLHIAMTSCDELTETIQYLLGRIQDRIQNGMKVNSCVVAKLWHLYDAPDTVEDHLAAICGLVLPMITFKERLKMSNVVVVNHEKFLRQLDLARRSNILMVFLFHLNCFMSYQKAVEEYIELTEQYHYEHGEYKIKFVLAKREESAEMFKVSFYPTVVVIRGAEEVGRVSIVNTGFRTGVFSGVKVILNSCLEDDDSD